LSICHGKGVGFIPELPGVGDGGVFTPRHITAPIRPRLKRRQLFLPGISHMLTIALTAIASILATLLALAFAVCVKAAALNVKLEGQLAATQKKIAELEGDAMAGCVEVSAAADLRKGCGLDFILEALPERCESCDRG